MKILHIIVNSKKEEESSSRKVARELVNTLMEYHPGCELEEINLYEDYIPRLKASHFSGRSCFIERTNCSTDEEKKEIDRINELCAQFIEADAYVIAAPLWSMSFPAPLKEYIDCIVQQGKTIDIKEDGVEGLLGDKKRVMIYVQSSGGPIPFLLRGKMSQGVEYVEDLMKVLGIKKFKELLVDGTGFTEESKQEAEEKAMDKIKDMLKGLRGE